MSSPDPRIPKPPAAFTRAMADHQGRLRAYVVSLLLDPHAADDVLQETNLVLCRKAGEFEPGTNFKAWAFRIAFLEAMRHRRTTGRSRLVFDEDLIERLEAAADQEDGYYEARRRRLRNCLQRLGELQRRLLLERYVRARTVQEIAVDRNRKANAIYQLLFRARQNLANCMAAVEMPPSGERTNGPGRRER